MASLRAHLLVPMVRLGVRARLGREPSVASIRHAFDHKGFPPPRGVGYRPGALGGIPGEWVQPETVRRDAPRLLYLHGGGFVGCSALQYRPITGSFARAGFQVFAPDYRLAPEHPFPAAFEDSLAAWGALVERGPAVIGGDSAGGNLALAVMGEGRHRGLRRPAGAALFSPAIDMVGRGASFRENAKRDAMFSLEALDCIARTYLAGTDPTDPRVSPLEADCAGLPPLLIHAAEGEMLRDDAVQLAARAARAGVRVELKLWPVVPHAWQLAEWFVPEARASLAEAAEFLKQALLHETEETRRDVAS